MEIQIFKVGQLRTNCYLVIAEIDQKCLIIDPGDAADQISEEIMRQDLEPQAIVATHGHYDHIMAISELQLAFGLPFLVNQQDEFLVKRMKSSAQHWMGREIIEEPPQINDYLTEATELDLGNEKLQVMLSPGHTPGGVCLYNQTQKIVFTGDTIFANAVGRTDLSYSSKADLHQSLKKIKNKFEDYLAYPGHGAEFRI